MNLFTYGTLMSREGFEEALGDRAQALVLRPARLVGWRRIWNVYRSEWNGGVLNVEPSPGSTVVGILVEGLESGDFVRLDAQEATHLPRGSVSVEPIGGEPVLAHLYHRRAGNHTGRPSGRYRSLVLERARAAGWEIYESVCRGTVNPRGEPLHFA
jgi:Gamma-glutamyl cyclotransferase, AIG2-like